MMIMLNNLAAQIEQKNPSFYNVCVYSVTEMRQHVYIVRYDEYENGEWYEVEACCLDIFQLRKTFHIH